MKSYRVYNYSKNNFMDGVYEREEAEYILAEKIINKDNDKYQILELDLMEDET